MSSFSPEQRRDLLVGYRTLIRFLRNSIGTKASISADFLKLKLSRLNAVISRTPDNPIHPSTTIDDIEKK